MLQKIWLLGKTSNQLSSDCRGIKINFELISDVEDVFLVRCSSYKSL